jgi:outer membrane protein OmpA-like peptidoglycan-associated protein
MATRSVHTPHRQSQGLWIVGLILLGMIVFILVRKADEISDTRVRNQFSLNTIGAVEPGGWESIDRNAALVRYPEIVNLDIEVRADEQFAVYAMDRNVLFEKGQSAFREGTEESLVQVLRSIRQRFDGGRMLISGTADEDDPDNRTLALARANALRHWLTEQGLDEKSIDVEAGASTTLVGEKAKPRHRVEILVRR